MTIKKIGIFIGTVGLITALIIGFELYWK